MDFSEKWGTSVDEAVKLCLEDLGTTLEEVDVTVLEEPSRGFLGFGSKLAKVRVELKKKPEVKVEQVEVKVPQPKKVEPKKTETKERPVAKKNNNKKEKKPVEKFELPTEPIIEKVSDDKLTVVESHAAIDFLKAVSADMGLEVEITAKEAEGSLYVDIQGKDSGTIIGKRGQTLDAIQYLTSLVVNKGTEDYTRVVVDAENYRAKREKTLELLAVRLANKVVKSKRSVKLEPMNPYERKVIHATLQNHPKVTTRSEGQEPYRRVIIELK